MNYKVLLLAGSLLFSLALFCGCQGKSAEKETAENQPSTFVYRDWVEVRKSNGTSVSVNPSSYSKTENGVKYWLLFNLQKPKTINGKEILYGAQVLSTNCSTNEVGGPYRQLELDKAFNPIVEETPAPDLAGPAFPYSFAHAAGMFMCRFAAANSEAERDEVVTNWQKFYQADPLKAIQFKYH